MMFESALRLGGTAWARDAARGRLFASLSEGRRRFELSKR
jgi:hypothetical protein